MDPWQPQIECPESEEGTKSVSENKFDDSFVEFKVLDNAGEEAADPHKKLADTDAYLDKLYGRLGRLQQAPSSRQLVSALRSGREDQLARLLSSDPAERSAEEPVPSEPVSAGYLQRRLLPHTVPLSSDELLQLLKEDHLQRQAADQ